MTEKVLEFLMECPHLEGAAFNVNYLDGKPLACSVSPTGDRPVIKRYADGGSLCSAAFRVLIRQGYSSARGGNAVACRLCENVEQWVKDMDRQGRLPLTKDGIQPLSLEVTKSFALEKTASVDGVFGAEVRLVYAED